MLVLNRKEGESIELPQLGISIRVVRTADGKVKLGIDAPDSVRILRGELLSKKVCPATEKELMLAEAAETYSVSG